MLQLYTFLCQFDNKLLIIFWQLPKTSTIKASTNNIHLTYLMTLLRFLDDQLAKSKDMVSVHRSIDTLSY